MSIEIEKLDNTELAKVTGGFGVGHGLLGMGAEYILRRGWRPRSRFWRRFKDSLIGPNNYGEYMRLI